jgi:5'-methylthioadenosine phosphorylase
MTADGSSATIAVIGGTGFATFFDDGSAVRDVTLDTPFGPPSAPLTIGQVAGRSVAFLPRHGLRHEFPPHRVNYRANLWALRSLGVRQVLGPCAVGSLRPELGPGTVVIPDQVVDRTWGRAHTVYDEPGVVVHTAFADPYCPNGRAAAAARAESAGWPTERSGTLVVINGPRFSSRAESQWHAAAGWSVVGMTGLPEASIARELALCYTSIALVTDHDAGVESGGPAVTHAEVLEVFGRNVERLRALLAEVVEVLPGDDEDCVCRHSLDGLPLPFDLP